MKMKCGAKRFLVDIEVNGERKTITVTARTPVAARKLIRSEFQESVHIIAVREESKVK